ncbi:hypothetical protein HMPREF0043_02159 [Actinobaculum sp. oral taxon 183 str. F0552]|nr:hypothetical protein HMPREF0043_02159 [Actinobaculum sp. oral taxon 183 str. F0552]
MSCIQVLHAIGSLVEAHRLGESGVARLNEPERVVSRKNQTKAVAA